MPDIYPIIHKFFPEVKPLCRKTDAALNQSKPVPYFASSHARPVEVTVCAAGALKTDMVSHFKNYKNKSHQSIGGRDFNPLPIWKKRRGVEVSSPPSMLPQTPASKLYGHICSFLWSLAFIERTQRRGRTDTVRPLRHAVSYKARHI